MMSGSLNILQAAEFEKELSDIASWWLTHAVDHAQGGIYGEISDKNIANVDAIRSSILQTRTLWFFSEYAALTGEGAAREAADALFDYIAKCFLDQRYGGIYWSVTADGAPASVRKQTYAQAFAIYALSAYASLGGNKATELAVELARLVEDRAWDNEGGGYIEAFDEDWSPIDDVRLSERDLNAPKTMNTHLHVLEAYTALHRVIGSEFTHGTLDKNIRLFDERFAAPHGGKHLALFYSTDWREFGAGESYGHDIEASWLLYEAAEALGDDTLLQKAKERALTLAGESLNAVDSDGGFIYERHETGAFDRKRHWWPQAEAMVGFYNAYQLSGDEQFTAAAARVWAFVKAHQIDRNAGEWTWYASVDQDARGPYKAGFWKGPYHNGRAMLEMIRRLGQA